MQDNFVTQTCASTVSGLASALLSTPADMVKTRMMNQRIVDGRCVAAFSGLLRCEVANPGARQGGALLRFRRLFAHHCKWLCLGAGLHASVG